MKVSAFFILLFASCLHAAQTPNVLIIYTDDLGYNDVSCYGAKAIATPNIDRIAKSGLRFTQGYATASTCTPSRYSLLTGEYPFRKNARVLPGNAKLLIDTDRQSLPDVFKSAGYQTGIVGKWHLGLGDGKQPVDWNQPVSPGPADLGFDHSFILPATNDRVPCVYMRDGKVVGLDPGDPIQVSYRKKIGNEPTGGENPELLSMKCRGTGHNGTIINGIGRMGFMTGGKAARWDDETMADRLTDEAIAFMKSSGDKPFFLYFSTADIHAPRISHPRFHGKSKLGARGDMTLQLDDCVGRVLDYLEASNLSKNTLIIFSSDNGPILEDQYYDGSIAAAKAQNFDPSGIFRGGKYSAYEAGTRVPLIISWPGKIEAGTTSDAVVSQVDFLASFAALLGQKVTGGSARDSLNTLDTFLGKSQQDRPNHVTRGHGLQLREGDWRLVSKGKKVELYNIAKDPSETKDLSKQEPEKVRQLSETLKNIKE